MARTIEPEADKYARERFSSGRVLFIRLRGSRFQIFEGNFRYVSPPLITTTKKNERHLYERGDLCTEIIFPTNNPSRTGKLFTFR